MHIQYSGGLAIEVPHPGIVIWELKLLETTESLFFPTFSSPCTVGSILVLRLLVETEMAPQLLHHTTETKVLLSLPVRCGRSICCNRLC